MLAQIVYLAFNVYTLGLMAYVVSGWVALPQAAEVRRFLDHWYTPPLELLRKYIRPIRTGSTHVDPTPVVLLLLLQIARNLLVNLLVTPF